MPKQNTIETLESLVALNKTPEAIEQLKNLLNTFSNRYETDLRAMESRANSVKWQSIRGTTDYKDISLEERNINFAFLSLLNELRSELENNLNFYNAIDTSREDSVKKMLDYLQSRASGRYTLDRVLKMGTSVITISAMDVLSKRKVAIKMLKSAGLDYNSELNPGNKSPVQQEVERVINLKHRNIIKIFEVYFDTYPYFLVTEYVWGVDLEEILESSGSLPWLMALDILCEICDTLEYVHRYSIFHSCIRPSKIMLDEEGKPVISPFEVIKAGNLSRSREKIKEDCRYLSKELLESDMRADNWVEADPADQYSLALLAYELMAGKPLFDGASLPEIMRQRERFYADPDIGRYLPPGLKDPKFDDFWQIVGKMLSNDPSDRYESLNIVLKNFQKLKPSADHDHEIALASYNRCLANKPDGRDFITAFYDNFFKKSESAKAMFKTGSDARERQVKMFRNAVRMFLESSSHPTYVQKLKSLPVHKAVETAQYREFLEQFLETVRQYDALCKPGSKVESVWLGIREHLLKGIEEAG